ncbi:hypothetical protein Pmani_038931 [Petrolisthes manimaculis]|uniref:Uncharacterized protein n=1 Tax=Petrolisthes manimaculis TaxID=1843537 RepID=A0AAE1TJY4_9EUCA|nr:hypothetical protein Pmani_038931 [Petrolisthes manimaculis]
MVKEGSGTGEQGVGDGDTGEGEERGPTEGRGREWGVGGVRGKLEGERGACDTVWAPLNIRVFTSLRTRW